MRPLLLKGHAGPIAKVKYNRDGDLLFSTAKKDSKPTAWYSHSGERLGTYNGHEGAVVDVDVDFHTRRLLTASADRTVKLWEVETGKLIHSWEHKGSVRGVGWATGDSMMLTVQENNFNAPSAIFIYNVEEGKEFEMEAVRCLVPPKNSKITCALWAPLNEFIFAGTDDGVIRKWDVETGSLVESVNVHRGPVRSLTYSKDKSMFITASADYSAKLLDTASLSLLKTYKSDRPLNAAAISPIFNHVIIAGGQDARTVTTTGARAGKFEVDFHHMVLMDYLGSIKGHFGPVNTLAFCPDGKSYASGSEDGYIRVQHFDQNYLNSKAF